MAEIVMTGHVGEFGEKIRGDGWDSENTEEGIYRVNFHDYMAYDMLTVIVSPGDGGFPDCVQNSNIFSAYAVTDSGFNVSSCDNMQTRDIGLPLQNGAFNFVVIAG